RFKVEESVKLEDIEKARDEGRLDDLILPIDEVLDGYSKCVVSDDAEKLVMNGNIFTSGDTKFKMNHEDGQIVRVYKEDETFIGLYKFNAGKRIYKPEKMFI
ncbi:MAG: tRNA pseudouridine(55) synthase, partial [Eubacterium sp.]|nr:tRNA pseudouridine(55) synthase [Eubacterium sp.]